MNVRVIGVGCAIAAALSAASASAAVQPVPVNPDMPPTTATLSSTKAAAKPVALTLKLHYEMQCGQPGVGKAVVTLPTAVTLPSRIDESAVLVNGKPAPLVSVSGHDVSIAMPAKRTGVTCMIIGPGTLTLTLTRAAGLGNPKSAGTYTVHVHRTTVRSTQPFQASFQISA